MVEPGTHTLKRLGERATYSEIVRFLSDLNATIFVSEILPPDEPPEQIFVPTLDFPQAAPKQWPLAIRQHRSETERERYLYIGDIFKLIDEIHAKLIFDGEQLSKANVDSEAGSKVGKLIAAENDLFTHIRFQATRELITIGQEEFLLEYRQGHYRELRERLETYIEVAIEVARELNEDPEALKELQLDLADDRGEAFIAPVDSEVPRGSQPVETEAHGGEEGSNDQEQTQYQQQTQPVPQERSVRQNFESIRTLGLESERITNAFLVGLANKSGIPIEILRQELHDVVRFNVEKRVIERVGMEGLGDLYANPGLRLQILSDFRIGLYSDPRFSPALSSAVESAYRELKSKGDRTALLALHKKLEGAKNSDSDMAEFSNDVINNPIFGVRPDLAFAGGDSQSALLEACDSLAYFDSGNLSMQVHGITERIDALTANGKQPAFLDILSTDQFNQIFNTSLTPDEFKEFKGVLTIYWHLRRHEYITGGAKLEYGQYGVNPADRDELKKTTKEEFDKKHVQPVKNIISSAGSNGGYARDHVIAAGTGVGDDTKNPKNASTTENIYIKKLKLDIYNQEIWRSLKLQEQIAIYEHYYQNQYEADEIQRLLQSGHIPPNFCLGDVGEAQIVMAQNGINGRHLTFDEYSSAFDSVDTGLSPLASLRRRMAGKSGVVADAVQATGQIGDASNAAKKAIARSAGGAGKRAAKRAANQAGKTVAKTANKNLEKAFDKTIAKGSAALAGAALGMPGLGAAVGALPADVQDAIGKTIKYVGAGLAAGGLIMAALWGNVIMPAFTATGALIGGVTGFIVGGPIGAVIGTGVGAAVGTGVGWLTQHAGTISNSLSNTFGGTASTTMSSAATPGIAGNSFLPSLVSPTHAATATSTAAATTTTATAATGISTGMVATATQAVAGTAIGMVASVMITNGAFTAALLADFPSNQTNASDPDEKLSDYASLTKTIDTGCLDDKCPEITSGTQKVTYTITITPTGVGTCITITEINDIIKTRYSKKKYEELGRPVPTKPDKEKHLEDFVPPLSTDLTNPANTVCTGSSLTLTYEEEFDSSYNHSQITNTFEAIFYWKNATSEGNDNVMTGKSFCIGDCSMTAGCWPTTGVVSQAPFGSYSHGRMDAFDIAAPQGTPVYAPFPGTLCKANIDSGCGNHLTLQSAEGSFLFCHFSETYVNGCKEVDAGEVIGLMGNTGNSSGSHLHYEIARNGAFFRAGPPSELASIVPPSDECIKPITVPDEYKANVTSCYDKEPPACSNN